MDIRVTLVFLVVITSLITLGEAQCSAYTECTACYNLTACDWCLSTSRCMTSYQALSSCSNTAMSLSSCPAPKQPQQRTPKDFAIMGIFLAIYACSLVAVIVVHIMKRRAIAPVVEAHSKRSGILDFNAFPNSTEILTKLHNYVPNQGDLVWADVSLLVPQISELIGSIMILVFGTLTVIIIPHQVFVPVFLFFLIPATIMLVVSIRRLVKEIYTGELYWMTAQGASIEKRGACYGSTIMSFPYNQMKDITTTTAQMGTGSVFFATRWERTTTSEPHHHHHDDHHDDHHHGHHHDHHHHQKTTWKKVAIGFQRIVRYGEVERLLRERYAMATTPVPIIVPTMVPVQAPPAPIVIINQLPPQQQSPQQPPHQATPYTYGAH